MCLSRNVNHSTGGTFYFMHGIQYAFVFFLIQPIEIPNIYQTSPAHVDFGISTTTPVEASPASLFRKRNHSSDRNFSFIHVTYSAFVRVCVRTYVRTCVCVRLCMWAYEKVCVCVYMCM